MDPLSLVCIVTGVLIIVARAPMVFAPRAALRVYERLLSNNVGIRAVGLLLAGLGLALALLTRSDGASAILHGLGWIFSLAALWLLAAPASYGRLATGVIDFFESSVDGAIVRLLGLLGVVLGAGLIWVGLYVV